jgi:hypothetical protein
MAWFRFAPAAALVLVFCAAPHCLANDLQGLNGHEAKRARYCQYNTLLATARTVPPNWLYHFRLP